MKRISFYREAYCARCSYKTELPLPTVMGEGALVRPKDLVGDVSGDTIPSRSDSSFRYAAKGNDTAP